MNKVKHNTWLIFILLFIHSNFQAQNNPNIEIDFLNSLLKKNEYTTAINYINKILKFENDSIKYIKAWSYYSIDEQDSARKYFNAISKNNASLFNEGKLFSASSAYFSKKYFISDSLINTVDTAKVAADFKELILIQRSGIALLKRDFKAYNTYSTQFKFNNYNFQNEELALNLMHDKLKNKKKKNPVIAALLSAIIPGSGKWYAGNRGQALTSFFSFALPAAIATESYFKSGPKSALFISSAILTSIFYSGSILGSAYSVKRNVSSFNNDINEKILLNIHIPLRRFYSK
jgi:TM2 domain-containing membrane protein YozV